MSDELVEGMRALGLTPAQRAELDADPDRALGWIRWAQKQGKGAGAVLAEFRSGDEAPDPDAWYEADRPRGPNRGRLLAAAASLVEHTAHELTEADYLGETYVVKATGESVVSEGEFERLGRDPKVGNGARLSDDDVRHGGSPLERRAPRPREHHCRHSSSSARASPSTSSPPSPSNPQKARNSPALPVGASPGPSFAQGRSSASGHTSAAALASSRFPRGPAAPSARADTPPGRRRVRVRPGIRRS